MTKMGQTKKIKKVIPVRYHDGLSQLRANAAGIDIGASEIWVDVAIGGALYLQKKGLMSLRW
jgi:hypothetical protein